METQNISPEKLKKFKNTDNAIAFIYNMYHLLFCRQLKKKQHAFIVYSLQSFSFFGDMLTWQQIVNFLLISYWQFDVFDTQRQTTHRGKLVI